ncbi:hypothetical protein ABPG74_021442 [Tetrahymena malaccensis]
MIHLDTYLENFESKLEEIQNSIVYVKSYKKPKIKISRLSEERKFVPVELDIEINENLVIKDRFDWNLNDENVSVEDFVNELCDTLNLPEINRTRLKSSLIYQLIDYVERNTYNPRLKNKDQKNDDEEYELDEDIKEGIANSSKISGLNESKLQSQLREQQEEDQKKTARQRKLDEMRRSSNSQIQPIGKASYIRDRRSCKNCNYVNNAPSFECKKCKIAFYILDMLDISQWRVAQAVQYYEICLAYFPLLGDYVKDYTNLLSVQDFASIYSLKIALMKLFPTMKELTESNLKIVNEKLEDLFASFLAGIVVYRQEEEVLPQKRRGRKSKAWHEDQEKRKKEKRERKERGEVVSSDVEDEDDSDDEDDLQAINKKIQEIEQQTNNQGGQNGIQNGTQNTKDATNQDNGEKDDESNLGAQNEGDLESNTDGSVVIRRGRGRPPKKQTYQGKKRGRKPKSMSESLIRASSKNIGDQDKEKDEDEQQMQEGNDKKENQSDGDDEDDEVDSKIKSFGAKNDENIQKEDQMDEESLPIKKNTSVDSKAVKSDLNKKKDKFLEEDDEDQFDIDDEDDEDYGSVAKKSSGKRGRPPKNKSLVQGKRGRKPLAKKDEKQQMIDEESTQNQDNNKEQQNQQNENDQNVEGMEVEGSSKVDDKEKQSTALDTESKIQQQQTQSKISKRRIEDNEEGSNQVVEDSQDEEFQIKKQPVKTGRRGRPRKEEQQQNKEQEEIEAEDQESSNFPNKKQKIIQKPLRTRFTRHIHHLSNSIEENKQQWQEEEDKNESNKIQTKKQLNLRSKLQENSEDEDDNDKSQTNLDEEDYEVDKRKKKKDKSNIKKKDISDEIDENNEDEEEEFDLKKTKAGKKKEKLQIEDEDNSNDKDINSSSNQDKQDNDENEENEENQGEDQENDSQDDEDNQSMDDDQEEEQESENSDDDEEEEESPANGVRTRRSQRTQSNDSNAQKKKEIPKQKKIVKEKSSSQKYEQTNDMPRKKGRPPKKVIQRGRKK